MKRAIIVQGPSSNVLKLKEAWGDYDIIWSTWKNEEQHYESEDIVIYNEIPKETGIGNIRLQQITTLNGVLKAKELGYDRVFKWRSDMVPTNPSALIALLEDSVNFLFFHNTLPYKMGYYVDYIVESDVDTMISIWDFNELYSTHAEEIITSNIYKKNINNINLFGGCLDDDNDIIWLNRNINLKNYKKHNEYEHNSCINEI
jgi:hypothetical protein